MTRSVRYLVKEGVADVDDLFGFVSDLRTDEAATVERARSETGSASASGPAESGE
ncbi:hypothetical protein [Haloplanus salilacus]|uniref:hypothetical protein n=1 Tax=Haloplanus salilacus TaxID=2949994 RepID=UPI0030D3BCF1